MDRYYLVVQSNELLIHVTTCMNLQGIIPSKWQKSFPKYYILHYFIYITFRNDKILDMKDR